MHEKSETKDGCAAGSGAYDDKHARGCSRKRYGCRNRCIGKNAAVKTDIDVDTDGIINAVAEPDRAERETQMPTASGQLADKPLGTETPSATEAEAMDIEGMVKLQ